LDSTQFATRQQAAAALRRLGRAAESALRDAKQTSASAEVRRRATDLLAELEKSTLQPEDLRAVRAVEVMERLATPDARTLLGALAKGDPTAQLTQAAEQALKRLASRD